MSLQLQQQPLQVHKRGRGCLQITASDWIPQGLLQHRCSKSSALAWRGQGMQDQRQLHMQNRHRVLTPKHSKRLTLMHLAPAQPLHTSSLACQQMSSKHGTRQ